MQLDELKLLFVMKKCDVPQLQNQVQVLRTMLEWENLKDKIVLYVEMLNFIRKHFPYLHWFSSLPLKCRYRLLSEN